MSVQFLMINIAPKTTNKRPCEACPNIVAGEFMARLSRIGTCRNPMPRKSASPKVAYSSRQVHSRGKAKRASWSCAQAQPAHCPDEAKDRTPQASARGMRRGLTTPERSTSPFVFSSNGDGFLFHDRTGNAAASGTG